MILILVALVAAALGGVLVLLFSRQQRDLAIAKLSAQKEQEKAEQLRDTHLLVSDWKAKCAALEIQLEAEQKASGEKLSLIVEAETKLREAFQALSAEALKQNNQSFLELAKTSLERFQEGAKGDLEKRHIAIQEMVKPVKESLEKVDVKIQELEKARVGAYESLTAQVRSLVEGQQSLRSETTNLVQALRSPVVRGRWGEIQLRRVVEMAGMLNYCDFYEQESVNSEQGRIRPDLLVRLPAEKNIIVDAKAPLSAYLDAMDAKDEESRKLHLQNHARQIRSHVDSLTRKAYWQQFESSPEFVVLFLPGESFFSAALEHDPSLIEFGVERKIILATPTTLIALLRAVFYGWRQEKLARNAQEISKLGQELYKRLADMGTHLERLGKNLNSAVDSFNKTVGSMETRVLVSARKFQALDAAQSGLEIPDIEPLEHMTRPIQADELLNEKADL